MRRLPEMSFVGVGAVVRRRRLVVAAVAIVALLAGMAAARTAGDPDRSPAGGWTFVRSVPGDRAVVWAVGDGADGSAEARAVVTRIASGPVSRFLYLGDVYPNGTAQDYADNYQTTYGPLAGVTAPTAGNHEARNELTGYDPYWQRVHGVRAPDWYAFRAGGWTILALDSEAAHQHDSAQERWLRRQVEGHGTCRIAFLHRPRFSAGVRHGDQTDIEPLVEVLRGRAAIVIAGHDHDMQRFRPIDGITHFVSGAGGRELYGVRDDRRLAFGDGRHRGALRLELSAGVARHAFVTPGGRTLDQGTVHCRPLG